MTHKKSAHGFKTKGGNNNQLQTLSYRPHCSISIAVFRTMVKSSHDEHARQCIVGPNIQHYHAMQGDLIYTQKMFGILKIRMKKRYKKYRVQ